MANRDKVAFISFILLLFRLYAGGCSLLDMTQYHQMSVFQHNAWAPQDLCKRNSTCMKIILSVMVFNISKQKNKSKTCLMGDSFVWAYLIALLSMIR